MQSTRAKSSGCYLGFLMLVPLYALTARGDFAPIPLTSSSYNQDIVVESTAPAPVVANGYTSATMDAGPANTGYTWYERGYNAANATTGLPLAGSTFTHQNSANHQYRMAASYLSNNAVVLDSALSTARLTLVSPTAYSQLSLLESGGHNGVTFNYTVHHQNGSVETGTASIPDWFNGSSPAWTANGRLDAVSLGFDSVGAGNPRLYSLDFNVANATSPITSIDFQYVSGSGHGAIMALSGANGGSFSPISITGYNADIVVEASAGTTGALSGVTTATMDTGVANTGNTWYEQGYVVGAPASGLPKAGTMLTNFSAPDHRYLLPPSYTVNNAVLLRTNGPSGSLTPTSPIACAALSFLVAAGNGPVTVLCNVRHANGTIETTSFSVPDWFTRAPVACVASGRVNVSNKTVNSLNSGNPRLYAVDMPLVYPASAVTNVTLTWQTGSSGSTAAIFAISGGSAAAGPPGDDFNWESEMAGGLLQEWYNSSGLWDTTGWWNSANCVEALENLVYANDDVQYLPVLTNTFNLNSGASFLNTYYDDEGWWANAWIRAYDLTGNPAFLNMAKTIFSDLLTGWDTSSCGGGVWWSKDRNYKNAIPNELFLLAAIRLHQRTPGDSGAGSYFYWATNEWTWFKASGMLNSQSLVNDGLNSNCQNNGQTTWTYNQGVLIGGLTDLYKSTGDLTYLNQATAIADAATARLVDANGVLVEPCESGDCGGDGPQFKGIFLRYLAYLYDVTRKPAYYTFLYRNAHAVWANDRNNFYQLGLKWDGPFDASDAARQSSALMPVSALAEPVTGDLLFAKGSGDPAFKHSIGFASGTLGWAANPASAPRADFMQYGPYVSYLPAGLHAAHFQLMVDRTGGPTNAVVRLDVRDDTLGSTLASLDVAQASFRTAGVGQDFVLLFTNRSEGDPLEFRVYWNNPSGAPMLTVKEVSIDGLMNWTAANLTHDVGRLDGLNCWEADPVKDKGSGYLARGPGSPLPPGNYSAQFELRVDNFNQDNANVAALSVLDLTLGTTVASRTLARTSFPNTRFQNFALSFNSVAGHQYDFRTFWYYSASSPRVTERSVLLRPGSQSFFTSAAQTNGVLTLGFVGTPGHTYTVQSSASLGNSQWTTLGSTTVPVNLGFGSFTTVIGATAGYYRLRN